MTCTQNKNSITLWTWSAWRDVYTEQRLYYTVNMIGITWRVHRTKTLLHCEHDRYHVTCTQNKDSITLWTRSVIHGMYTIVVTWHRHVAKTLSQSYLNLTSEHTKNCISLWAQAMLNRSTRCTKNCHTLRTGNVNMKSKYSADHCLQKQC